MSEKESVPKAPKGVFGKNDVKTEEQIWDAYEREVFNKLPKIGKLEELKIPKKLLSRVKREWVLRERAEQEIQKRDKQLWKNVMFMAKQEKEIQKLRSELADLKFKFKRKEEDREQAVNVANEMILKNTKFERRIAEANKILNEIIEDMTHIPSRRLPLGKNAWLQEWSEVQEMLGRLREGLKK